MSQEIPCFESQYFLIAGIYLEVNQAVLRFIFRWFDLNDSVSCFIICKIY
jgi:hypothetical protein